jgi:hypothetical protein
MTASTPRASGYRHEQIGCARDVFERDIEEQILTGFALAQLLADGRVIRGAVLNRVVEDRWIRGQPGHRQILNVALERATIQQVSRDVVEPKALTQIV